ncbi:MAG: hypothetical protein AB1546_14260 [bacterium]
MIIKGRFIGDAPYFSVHLGSAHFQGLVWFLADTGASRTTLLDRDVRQLGIPVEVMEPASLPIVGIGGSVRSFMIREVEITMPSGEGDVVLHQDLWVVQHDLGQLPPEEVARILRLPSIVGRDLINRFHFTCGYQAGIVQLERYG